MNKSFFTKILLILIVFSLQNCTFFKKKNEQKSENDIKNVKKKDFEFNTEKRLEKAVQNSGGLFTRKPTDTLGNKNILWEAAVQTLGDLPILSASYDGGVITTDWYGNQNEKIRINIIFTSGEIKASSFDVKSFKQICDIEKNCKTVNGSKKLNQDIKDQILKKLAELKINRKG